MVIFYKGVPYEKDMNGLVAWQSIIKQREEVERDGETMQMHVYVSGCVFRQTLGLVTVCKQNALFYTYPSYQLFKSFSCLCAEECLY